MRGIRKYASFATLAWAEGQIPAAPPSMGRTAHRVTFDYTPKAGMIYVRSRAISSRTNDNYDNFPADEISKAYRTFVGKPVFVNHHNHNHRRARGVIKDAALHNDVLPNGETDTWVEVLMEVDAVKFPKLAKAILKGHVDRTSMGCFLPGTPITLADGTQKPIETIVLDDEVLTHTGKMEPVTYVMERPYEGVVYDIRSYGQATSPVMTPEHPVWVRRDHETTVCTCGRDFPSRQSVAYHLREVKRWNHEGEHAVAVEHIDGWVEAKDVQVGDLVLTPMPEGVGNPGTWAHARLLGYYVAEGNLGWDRKRLADAPVSVEWNFHEDEVEYVQEVCEALRAIGYKAAGPYIKNTCATVRCNSPELAAWFFAMGGQHSWAKRLHADVMRWDPDNQRALVTAYLNGDGCYRGNRVEAGTASEDLARQIHLLALRSGIEMTPPVRQHSPSAQAGGRRPKYAMQAVLEAPERVVERTVVQMDERGMWRKVTDIRLRQYEGSVYNFDVEGDDSYVAADMAVHNCDVAFSVCSACGNKASTPLEYCRHIPNMKGQKIRRHLATGGAEDVLVYESCYGLKFFENSVLVEDPADPTAYFLEVDDRGLGGGYQGNVPRLAAREQPIDGWLWGEYPDGKVRMISSGTLDGTIMDGEDMRGRLGSEGFATRMWVTVSPDSGARPMWSSDATTATRKTAAKDYPSVTHLKAGDRFNHDRYGECTVIEVRRARNNKGIQPYDSVKVSYSGGEMTIPMYSRPFEMLSSKTAARTCQVCGQPIGLSMGVSALEYDAWLDASGGNFGTTPVPHEHVPGPTGHTASMSSEQRMHMDTVVTKHLGHYNATITWLLQNVPDATPERIAEAILDRDGSAVRKMTGMEGYIVDRDVWYPKLITAVQAMLDEVNAGPGTTSSRQASVDISRLHQGVRIRNTATGQTGTVTSQGRGKMLDDYAVKVRTDPNQYNQGGVTFWALGDIEIEGITSSARLRRHAAKLTFTHPRTGETYTRGTDANYTHVSFKDGQIAWHTSADAARRRSSEVYPLPASSDMPSEWGNWTAQKPPGAPDTCTIGPRADSGERCGKPAVEWSKDGRFAECAECAPQVFMRQHSKLAIGPNAPAREVQVGDLIPSTLDWAEVTNKETKRERGAWIVVFTLSDGTVAEYDERREVGVIRRTGSKRIARLVRAASEDAILAEIEALVRDNAQMLHYRDRSRAPFHIQQQQQNSYEKRWAANDARIKELEAQLPQVDWDEYDEAEAPGDGPPLYYKLQRLWKMRMQGSRYHAYGETVAPPQVDTLREENCPVCGEAAGYNGERCSVCQFVKPPDEFMDPDLSKAQETDLRQQVDEAIEEGTGEGDDGVTELGDAESETDAQIPDDDQFRLEKPTDQTDKLTPGDAVSGDVPSDKDPEVVEEEAETEVRVEEDAPDDEDEADDDDDEEGKDEDDSFTLKRKKKKVTKATRSFFPCHYNGDPAVVEVERQPDGVYFWSLKRSGSTIQNGIAGNLIAAQEVASRYIDEGIRAFSTATRRHPGTIPKESSRDIMRPTLQRVAEHQVLLNTQLSQIEAIARVAGINLEPIKAQGQAKIAQLRRTANASAVAEQSIVLETTQRCIDAVANVAGIDLRPFKLAGQQRLAAMRRTADEENPAQPVPDGAAEAPFVTSEEALGDINRATGETPNDVMTPGTTTETNVTPTATDSVTEPGAAVEEILTLNEGDVTAPTQGASEPIPTSDRITDGDVTARDGIDEEAFVEPNFTASSNTFQALRLARLKLDLGMEPGSIAQGSDLALGQRIASTMSTEDIRKEIDTLTAVQAAHVSAAQQAAPRQTQGTRRAVPSVATGSGSPDSGRRVPEGLRSAEASAAVDDAIL